MTHRDGAPAFVVTRASCQYDDEFEDALSDLDYEIANDADLDLIKMDAIALPCASDTAVSPLLDPGFILEYVTHGEGSGPRRAAE